MASTGAITDLCGGVQRDRLYICKFACARFGFNGDVILSVAYFLKQSLSVIYEFMMVFTAVNVNTFHANL